MEEHTDESSITLIIRAPNQKYDDQPIRCFLDWTVEKLKKHIANVYPSKPLSREQRLVYFGRLLQDHQQLREVLRTQDQYHMVHLVCTPRNLTGDSHDSTLTSDPSTSNAVSAGSAPSSFPFNQNVADSLTGSADGVRHRGGSADAQQQPEGIVFPAAPPATLAPYSVYTPVQVMWWQRVYAQHYYMRYQAAMAAAAAQAPPPPPSHPINHGQPIAPAPAPVNPAPLEQPANQNPQVNVQGGAVQNEEELNRDWLDWMYTVSRAAVLLSIVYFYSSFSRFVMVIGAMMLVYLHQAGWFPFRVELQNPGAAEQPPAENDRNHNIQEMEHLMDDGLEEDDDGDISDEGSDEAPPPPTSFLASMWSFISTFFTSLVPEGPRAAR